RTWFYSSFSSPLQTRLRRSNRLILRLNSFFLKHFKHTICDSVAADYVDGGEYQGYHSQPFAQGGVAHLIAGQKCPNYGDSRNRIGTRHQWCMKGWGNFRDQLKSQKTCENKYINQNNQCF